MSDKPQLQSFEITATRAVLGLLLTIVTAGGAGWMTSMQGQVSDLRATLAQKSESVTRLEARLEATQQQLSRMESKLDALAAHRSP